MFLFPAGATQMRLTFPRADEPSDCLTYCQSPDFQIQTSPTQKSGYALYLRCCLSVGCRLQRWADSNVNLGFEDAPDASSSNNPTPPPAVLPLAPLLFLL